MRFVFDTNVLVSALLLTDSKPRKALDSGKVLLSEKVQIELYEVLHRKQFRCYVDEQDVRNFLSAFAKQAKCGGECSSLSMP